MKKQIKTASNKTRPGKKERARRKRTIHEEQRALGRAAMRGNVAGAGFGLGLEDVNLPGFKLGKGFLGVKSKDLGGMVGVAPHSRNVQVAMPEMRTYRDSQGNQMDVLTGTEFLQSVTTAEGGNNSGDLLTTLLLSPSSLENTRLFQFAPLYQRYRFRRLEVVYGPTANATQSGQLIGFVDYDVDTPLTGDDPNNISVAAAHLGQRINQIWEGQTYPFGVVDDLPMLYTSETGVEDRLIYQGIFYLLASTDLASDIPLGNLYLRYECELSVPQLSPSVLPDVLQYYSALGGNGGLSVTAPFGSAVVDNSSQVLELPGLPPLQKIAVTYASTGSASQFVLTGCRPNTTYWVMAETGQVSQTTNANAGGNTMILSGIIAGDAQLVEDNINIQTQSSQPASVTGSACKLAQTFSFTTTEALADGFVSLSFTVNFSTPANVTSTTFSTVNLGEFYIFSSSAAPPVLEQVLSKVWKTAKHRPKAIKDKERRVVVKPPQQESGATADRKALARRYLRVAAGKELEDEPEHHLIVEEVCSLPSTRIDVNHLRTDPETAQPPVPRPRPRCGQDCPDLRCVERYRDSW